MTVAWPLSIRPVQPISWRPQIDFVSKQLASGAMKGAWRGADLWRAQLTFRNLTAAQGHILHGFLGAAMRQVYTGLDPVMHIPPFYFTEAVTRQGIGTGNPLVNGSSQLGGTLLTRSWTAGQNPVVKRGDLISYPVSGYHRMALVTDDVTADGSGNASIPIIPAITVSPTDGQPVRYRGMDYPTDSLRVYASMFFGPEQINRVWQSAVLSSFVLELTEWWPQK